jgi:hypothetical protein
MCQISGLGAMPRRRNTGQMEATTWLLGRRGARQQTAAQRVMPAHLAAAQQLAPAADVHTPAEVSSHARPKPPPQRQLPLLSANGPRAAGGPSMSNIQHATAMVAVHHWAARHTNTKQASVPASTSARGGSQGYWYAAVHGCTGSKQNQVTLCNKAHLVLHHPTRTQTDAAHASQPTPGAH